jgi:hypothetical protein
MGGLGKLAVVGAVRPSRDRGGSPELEMMAAGELVGGEGKRVATTGTRVCWSSANTSAHGGAMAGGGVRAPESGNKDMVCFFLFWQPKIFVSQIGVCRQKAHFLHAHAVVTPLSKMPPLLLTSW